VLDLVWLIPLLPLVGAALSLLLGRRLGKASGWLATGLVGLAIIVSVYRRRQTIDVDDARGLRW